MLALPPIPLKLPENIQDLPSRWAHLGLHMLSFVQDELGLQINNKGLLVGVSGGADSLCLLVLLKAVQKKLGLRLQVCHLDHDLRPSSAQEAAWVQAICKKLALPCHVHKINIATCAAKKTACPKKLGPKGNAPISTPINTPLNAPAATGLENIGREVRYALFEQVRQAEGLDFIATAHTLNDLGEDICMRLLRGCGWPELGGMTGYDPKRFLIRPLLNQPRVKLEEMLADCGLSYLTDETNASMDYLRNRVRKKIVPVFTSENSGFLEHCHNLWSLAADDSVFWEHYLAQLAKNLLVRHNNCGKPEICLPFTAFLQQDRAVRLRLYRYCLKKLEQIAMNPLANQAQSQLAEKSGAAQPQFFTPAPQIRELDNAVWRRVEGSGSGQMSIQFAGGAKVEVGKQELVFSFG